jgi:hypothetical protein
MSTLTSYREQREQLRARLADQAPAALLDGFAAAAQRLDAVDFAARAPKVGDEAPDFAPRSASRRNLAERAPAQWRPEMASPRWRDIEVS